MWVKVILVVFITMLPVNIFGIVSVNRTQEALVSGSRDNLQRLGQLAIQALDDRMTGNDYYMFQELEKDVDFQTLQQNGYVKADIDTVVARQGFFSTLQSRVNSYAHVDAYFFYFPDCGEGEATVGLDLGKQKSEVKESFLDYARGEDSTANTPWKILTLNGEKWLIREISKNQIRLGALIHLGTIEKTILRELNLDTGSVEFVSGTEKVDTAGKVAAVCTSQKADLQLVLTADRSEITGNLPLLQRMGLAIACLMLLSIPLLFFMLEKLVLKPIRILEAAMDRVESGENEYQIEKKASSREFRHLYRAFNRMIRTQKELKIQVYETKIQRQKTEIQNLQLQIRPHFLLNAFNLMFGLVSIGEIQSVQGMILYLSDYFRYIFRSGKDLEEFSKEYDLIKKYLEIAQLRYPDTFEAEYQIEEEALRVQVPPLLIHNLVENVICHGLVPRKRIQIRVTARLEGEMAEICVEDTGAGIPAEKAERYNRGEFDEEDGRVHVGLKNAYQRIREFYGKQGSITIDSGGDGGTRIQVRFPDNREKRGAEN